MFSMFSVVFLSSLCDLISNGMSPNMRGIIMLKMVSLLQRRCALEDWMEKILSDIDLSRTASVANFLELEAAVVSGI